MIFDLILSVLALLLRVLLLPLDAVNFIFDISSSISILGDFFNVIAYLLPWGNLLPLFAIVIGFIIFRITISIIGAIWRLTPFT